MRAHLSVSCQFMSTWTDDISLICDEGTSRMNLSWNKLISDTVHFHGDILNILDSARAAARLRFVCGLNFPCVVDDGDQPPATTVHDLVR